MGGRPPSWPAVQPLSSTVVEAPTDPPGPGAAPPRMAARDPDSPDSPVLLRSNCTYSSVDNTAMCMYERERERERESEGERKKEIKKERKKEIKKERKKEIKKKEINKERKK